MTLSLAATDWTICSVVLFGSIFVRLYLAIRVRKDRKASRHGLRNGNEAIDAGLPTLPRGTTERSLLGS